MLSWLRRTGRHGVVQGLASPADAGTLHDFAGGLADASRLRVHADDAALIADAGFGGARLVLLAGAEHEAPETAARIAAARHGAPCELAVLAEDPLIQIRLRDLDASLPVGLRVRPVSRTALLARRLFAGTAPPDRVLRLAGPDNDQPILIVGTGDALSAQLMLAALRLLQLPGLRAAISLAGPGMPALLARLRARLPELDQCGVLTAADAVARHGPPPALILATDATVPNAALRALDPDGIAPIVRPEIPSWTAVGQALKDDLADRMARDIHLLHLEERNAAGGRSGDQPSQAPWEDLPERFREASRHQASHIPLKLRWAGARILPAGAANPTPFTWTAAELTALAEAEHARWATVARLEGWSYGAVRDDAAKTTPLLVPFAALSQAVRDLDALPVRAAPRLAGGPVRRDAIFAVEAAAPETGFERNLRTALERMRGEAPVLRLHGDTPATHAVAEVAATCSVPIQVRDAGAGLARQAERVAIGAAAGALLPGAARLLRIGGDGRTE